MHKQQHPLAGTTTTVKPYVPWQSLQDGAEAEVRDWWDRLGEPWVTSTVIAAEHYRYRISSAALNVIRTVSDDEVVYVKIGGLGYLVHETELGATNV